MAILTVDMMNAAENEILAGVNGKNPSLEVVHLLECPKVQAKPIFRSDPIKQALLD
jgi:hypothetical protein